MPSLVQVVVSFKISQTRNSVLRYMYQGRHGGRGSHPRRYVIRRPSIYLTTTLPCDTIRYDPHGAQPLDGKPHSLGVVKRDTDVTSPSCMWVYIPQLHSTGSSLSTTFVTRHHSSSGVEVGWDVSGPPPGETRNCRHGPFTPAVNTERMQNRQRSEHSLLSSICSRNL